MSIFRREDPSPPPSPTTPQPVSKRVPAAAPSRPSAVDTTHIASGSKVVGELSGDSELVIDGEVEGEIRLKSRLVVGREGRVRGKVVAASVEVAGKIVGNVQGLEKVKVLDSGTLEGDVSAPRVIIDDGAFFKGNVDMTKKGAAAPEPKPVQKSQPSQGSQQSGSQSSPQSSKQDDRAKRPHSSGQPGSKGNR